mgnify:CR=1 FL=1
MAASSSRALGLLVVALFAVRPSSAQAPAPAVTDANTPLQDEVDIALYDTFAQPEADCDDIDILMAAAQAGPLPVDVLVFAEPQHMPTARTAFCLSSWPVTTMTLVRGVNLSVSKRVAKPSDTPSASGGKPRSCRTTAGSWRRRAASAPGRSVAAMTS